jgi:hypothetical protein
MSLGDESGNKSADAAAVSDPVKIAPTSPEDVGADSGERGESGEDGGTPDGADKREGRFRSCASGKGAAPSVAAISAGGGNGGGGGGGGGSGIAAENV